MNFKSLLHKKNYISALLISATILSLMVFPALNEGINNTAQTAYSFTRGQLQPDTNIVIINISESDINKLEHWPIKRSYYALLINSLSKYKVKKIGLEVFLSAKFVTQTLYDNLLTQEIEKNGNVVLSSVAGDIYLKNGKYYTDSLSFPSPKLLDENLKTGHLNYFGSNEIKIPLVIHNDKITENAFALELAGKNTGNKEGKELNINFISSWNKFHRIDLIKYFEMVNSRNPWLENLKGKIVLIGTSDPLIASTLTTTFDDSLPGVALHAFAIDNLFYDRGLNDNFMLPSIFLFILILAAVFVLRYKNMLRRFYLSMSILFAAYLTVTFLLFVFFNIMLSYSFFLLPFTAFVFTDTLFALAERSVLLEGVIDESNLLKTLLSNKETELAKLQKELDFGSAGSNSLVEKIKLLKEDISRLRENEEDKKEIEVGLNGEVHEFQNMIYRSKGIINIVDVIKKVAPGDANILILGESGTGKELAAKAIHELSLRNKNNFVAVNCGALSDTLLESELFGHVKGAFTGAVTDKMGRFEAADKGTIFLDEIAETTENFQVKLLRVIQSGDFEKVGSSKTQHADVRIIAATNKRLENEVKEKRFREDLYYRLNVIKIELPPLRERKDDIEVLSGHFLTKESPGMKLSKAAAEALVRYEWKGNVRELEAVIKRAVIFAKSSGRNMIQLADLTEEIVRDSKFDFEDMVIESLRNKNFSRSSIIDTAKELGNVSRTMVSENFRGYSLKCYIENDFDFNKAVSLIAGTDNEEVLEKVSNKLSMFIKNIENDLEQLDSKSFEEIRSALNSKYKNLPHKFHFYLDEIIKRRIL